jgi:hypothetical protein
MGRLDSGAARFLQPLLADGKLVVHAVVAGSYPRLELMASLELRLRIEVTRAAFTDAVAESQMHIDGVTERELAFVRLLDALRLRPLGGGGEASAADGATDRTSVEAGDGAWDGIKAAADDERASGAAAGAAAAAAAAAHEVAHSGAS